MKKDFLITNVKYFYVHVTSNYSNIVRITVNKEHFEKVILPYLALGYGCEHRVLCSNEFSSVHKDIFFVDSEKKCCYEMMYEREYL